MTTAATTLKIAHLERRWLPAEPAPEKLDRKFTPECAVDPETWFPSSWGQENAAQIKAAKEVCGRCPAQAPCLALGLVQPVEDGIWGGLTRDERKTLAASRRRASKLSTTTTERDR